MTPASGSADRAVAAVAADLLAQGARVHGLSVVLTVASLAADAAMALWWPKPLPMTIACAAAVAGLVELWFALRVGLDARLFARMANGLSPADLDAALQALGLTGPEKAGRPLPARVKGATRLLGCQAGLLVLQVVLLVAGAWLLVTRT
jgi:hypothetical protein